MPGGGGFQQGLMSGMMPMMDPSTMMLGQMQQQAQMQAQMQAQQFAALSWDQAAPPLCPPTAPDPIQYIYEEPAPLPAPPIAPAPPIFAPPTMPWPALDLPYHNAWQAPPVLPQIPPLPPSSAYDWSNFHDETLYDLSDLSSRTGSRSRSLSRPSSRLPSLDASPAASEYDEEEEDALDAVWDVPEVRQPRHLPCSS